MAGQISLYRTAESLAAFRWRSRAAGRCFVMESLEVAERVPPEQEIHVSYLAVYPLS